MTFRGNEIAAVWLIGAATAVGCGGSVASHPGASNGTSATTTEDEVSAGLMEHHQHHHHGGVTLLVALSLDTLGVSPDQRAAVEKIAADLHAKMEPARATEQALHALLAEGIAAGAIDRVKVDAALAQVAAAAAGAVNAASIDALDQLHAALTPPQRAALVDKLEAHWEVWQKANADEQTGPAGQPPKGGHLERLVREIGLTQDQINKIQASLAAAPSSTLDSQLVATHIRAFGDAFRADAFDAKTIPSSSADASLASSGAMRMVRFYEAVDPVLTAEQRTKLAEILREHASYPSTRGG